MKSEKPRKKLIGENQLKPDENFHTGGTVTGRLSSSPLEMHFLSSGYDLPRRMVHEHPNPQGLERPVPVVVTVSVSEVERRVKAKSSVLGELLNLDFSEIERRIAAHLSEKTIHALLHHSIARAVEVVQKQIDEEGCGAVIAALQESLVRNPE